MHLWQATICTAQGNEFATYYFENLGDALCSVYKTWEANPDEIYEVKMAEENHHVWTYSDGRLAVDITSREIKIQNRAIVF
jgi:uncharacterized protein YkuJ